MNFPVRTPRILMGAAPGLCWHMPRNEKAIYLTFDDGPHPGITPQVLDLLAQYNAKASFFCVGENVLRYPDVVRQTHAAGHALGNHTHNHLNGWKTSATTYLANIAEAESALTTALGQPTQLFRPPYGKLGLTAWRRLRQRYRIVMWDVAAGDFVQDWSNERVRDNVLLNAQAGSVVVLHDSEKCRPRMFAALEAALEQFSSQGFQFKAIG